MTVSSTTMIVAQSTDIMNMTILLVENEVVFEKSHHSTHVGCEYFKAKEIKK